MSVSYTHLDVYKRQAPLHHVEGGGRERNHEQADDDGAGSDSEADAKLAAGHLVGTCLLYTSMDRDPSYSPDMQLVHRTPIVQNRR